MLSLINREPALGSPESDDLPAAEFYSETVSARGVTVPNVVVGPAIFYGGVVQFLAGSKLPRSSVLSSSIQRADLICDIPQCGSLPKGEPSHCDSFNRVKAETRPRSRRRNFSLILDSNTFGATAFSAFLAISIFTTIAG